MKNKLETATLAGGCFWCTEAIFRRLKGVISVLPGYAGGNPPAGGKNPSYAQVCSGSTRHAESIQIEFDPSLLSFEKILDIFWHTHNIDRQFFTTIKSKKKLPKNQKRNLKKKKSTWIPL